MIQGSEDYSVGYYDKVPTKAPKIINQHKGFVNCVRFSPDGKTFISVSSDKVAE